jgi:hypothetical protein
MLEIRFESDVRYPQPFRDVSLDGVFTAPSGRTTEVPGFWAGDGVWCLRHASAEVGVHRFRTRCSDAGNAGLHGRSGELVVVPYTGANPLYRHGPIRVAPDRRHFCHADGTPFFWLGDTWWMGLCRRLGWPEDFQRLAHHRKAQGFNVIQLVAGLYPDMPLFDERGRSESGFCWEKDLSAINPRFFDEADQKMLHLVEQGLVPCILGAWGYYLPLLGEDRMLLHWRYLMARWSALPVVLVAAGEQTLPWYLQNPAQKRVSERQQKQDWSRVMAHMRAINGFGRLISTHPVTSAQASVTDVSLLDFEMQQTNHGLPTAHHAARGREGWRQQPPMPVISAESRYEALEIQPPVTARDAREAFWAHTLSSGLAGHTYGANGVWQVNTREQPFGASPSGLCWGHLPWDEAMHLPGASHIGQARRFIETLPWHGMRTQGLAGMRLADGLRAWPRLQRLAARLGWRQPAPHPVAMVVNPPQSMALVYTVVQSAFDVPLRALRLPLAASWVDPTNFTTQPAVFTVRGQRLHTQPPGQNAAREADWLLWLRPQAQA